jgi:hypothetical protein
VLIGLWDGYEQETKALGFSGIYERYLASRAGFADDAKAYRAVVEAERAQTAVVAETAANLVGASQPVNPLLAIVSPTPKRR